MKLAPLVLALCIGLISIIAEAKEISMGMEASSNFEDGQPLYNPKPEIPPQFQENALKTFCVAKFQIDTTGKATAKLVTSSGSEEIDEVILSALKRWRFKPATLDGHAVSSSKKIKIELEVN